MNKRQRQTLGHLFETPVRANVRWKDAELLLRALGATIQHRAGSRVAVRLGDPVAVFHRPHPGPEMDKGAVRDLRQLIENAEIQP